MKVGDYIRTKDGVIAKIEDIIADYSIDCDRDVFHAFSNNAPDVMEIPYVFKDEYIIKSSPDIIDLIEVGDIIRFEIECGLGNSGILKGVTQIEDVDMLKNIKENKRYHIKSIVTKEQFSQMEYMIGFKE